MNQKVKREFPFHNYQMLKKVIVQNLIKVLECIQIQLYNWLNGLSPKFALQVSEWIRNLFINGKVEINIKLLDEIKSKDERNKIFKNTYLKKYSRKNIQ